MHPGRGAAWFDDHPDAVCATAAQRLACAAHTITVDDGGRVSMAVREAHNTPLRQQHDRGGEPQR
jgi:hypothetical protein